LPFCLRQVDQQTALQAGQQGRSSTKLLAEPSTKRPTHAPSARMPAKMKLGSKWSIVRKDVVKETPAFVNFTKNVMALAAAKYQEELESLCDLFGSSTMYTTGKVSMEIPVLGHQIIKSKNMKGQEKGGPEMAAMPAPRAVDLDSSSSESDDDGAFWANRRKGLVLQKEDNLGDFVPMSETPPPPEPVTAHTDTAPERPPSAPVEIQEAAVETAYEGAPAGSPTLKKWNSKMMQKKIISLGGNSMAEQKLKALQKRAEREQRDHQNDAPLHASEVEDEDGEEGEEAEEQAQVSASGEQLTEEEQIARAQAKVAEKGKKRQEAETARWLRMNPKERVAAASKLALQQATQSLIPMLGHPDLSQTDELFSIMSTGLALLDDPRGAINALTDFVCSLGGEHWEDLIGELHQQLMYMYTCVRVSVCVCMCTCVFPKGTSHFSSLRSVVTPSLDPQIAAMKAETLSYCLCSCLQN